MEDQFDRKLSSIQNDLHEDEEELDEVNWKQAAAAGALALGSLTGHAAASDEVIDYFWRVYNQAVDVKHYSDQQAERIANQYTKNKFGVTLTPQEIRQSSGASDEKFLPKAQLYAQMTK